jgi:SAM-dependent methyltransferase
MARAWMAYQDGGHGAALEIHADDGEQETMPVSVFFRGEEGLRGVDVEALECARGRVLDGGAGVGSTALLLQERGFDVTALEVIPQGVEIMRTRGVKNPIEGRLEDLPKTQEFDTILLLMNGSALAGTLGGLLPFLTELEGLLAPGGQVLMDSTDLLHGQGWDDGEEGEDYPGDLLYQMEFRAKRGAPFPQLFLDPVTLKRMAEPEGWMVDILRQEEEGEYLARLTR